FNQQRSRSTTLKRIATSEGQRFGENSDDEYINGQWQVPNSKKYRRTHKYNDKDDRQQHQITGRRQQLSSNTDKNDRNISNGNSLQISKHALNYASEYHYAPFKLECHPKLIDKKQGQKLIMNLIKSIKSDFITQNPKFNKIILFDLWWIDSNGDLQIIIKTTELYVYLCKTERYPKELNGIKIIPHHPSHLPPQHTVIIKWVHHSISNDDIKEVLNSKYES
ncbi:unnamed protein product, partial [Rotaria sp. Silwood1]